MIGKDFKPVHNSQLFRKIKTELDLIHGFLLIRHADTRFGNIFCLESFSKESIKAWTITVLQNRETAYNLFTFVLQQNYYYRGKTSTISAPQAILYSMYPAYDDFLQFHNT